MGDLQDPYYWWVAGALWGTMLDYYHYTKDPSYNDIVIEALLAPTNLGDKHDYVPPEHALEEGNDDLFFWGSAVLSAAERNFPQPNKNLPSWLQIAENVFESLVSRWHTEKCGGGLRWQIYEDNPNGMSYKNSVSNGGFFQLAARLARATGKDTYLEWADKIWDWSYGVGIIDSERYRVYDGVSADDDCKTVNYQSFTYTSGIYLYGAAVLANHTKSPGWKKRASKLLDGSDWFFTPYQNATDIMCEGGCELYDRCTADMSTHKAFLSRFMWQTTTMLPSLKNKIEKRLHASAKAAAKSCTGGDDKRTCGTKWYVGGFDGKSGLGQQMNALEVIQGLLIKDSKPPLKADEIKTVRSTKWKALDTYRPDKAKPRNKPEAGKQGDDDKKKDDDDEENSARSRLR